MKGASVQLWEKKAGKTAYFSVLSPVVPPSGASSKGFAGFQQDQGETKA